jgi:hypothetical protein
MAGGLVAIVSAAAALWLAAAPASALTAHAFSFSFGSAGSGAGQLGAYPQSLAVNDATGDIYVADPENDRMDEFDSTGSFIAAWGDDVDATTGANVCTAASGDTCQAGTSGSSAGDFEDPGYVAVDNSNGPSAGDLYVADQGDDLITKFDPSGNVVTTWGSGGQLDGAAATGGPFTGLAGIAVDMTGNLFAYDPNTYNWFEFSQDGSADPTVNSETRGTDNLGGIGVDSDGNLYKIIGAGNVEQFSASATDIGPVDNSSEDNGFAIDPTNNDIYVTDGFNLDHYDGSTLASCVPAGNCPVAESITNPAGLRGVAINPTTGTVYAADISGEINVYTEAVSATTTSAADVGTTSATLQGTVDPLGTPVTGCHFDIVEAADYNSSASDPYSSGQRVACAQTPAQIGSGSAPVSITADASGLASGTTYEFRLVASDARATANGPNQTFSTSPAAVITDPQAENLTATTGDLTANINPEGLDTTYQFQWGTSTSYTNDVPAAPADLGSGTAPVTETAQLTGLTPNTTYHWRVIATDSNGTTTTADQTFVYETTGQTLPDGRAYELVSPPQKNGALVDPGGFRPVDIAADGSRIDYVTDQCFGDAGSCSVRETAIADPFLASRTSTGWESTALSPPASQYSTHLSLGFSADAGTAMFSVPTPPDGEDDFDARQSDGGITDVGPSTPPSSGALGFAESEAPGFATADLSHYVWSATTPEFGWPFDATPIPSSGKIYGDSAYEYSGSGNSQPVLVGVSGGEGSTDLISGCSTGLGNGNGNAPGTLSSDGSTVYFTAESDGGPPCPGGSGANAGVPVPANTLYARIDGTVPGEARTVLISGRSPSDCGTGSGCASSAPEDADFWGASSDGSHAFFTSTQQLTDSGTQGSNNLYLYDFDNPAGQELIDVSGGDSSGLGPQVIGPVGFSNDGSHIYFLANGVLASGASPGTCDLQADVGTCNLYGYERDAAFPNGHTAFIATLSAGDANRLASDVGSWPVANVTPDGRYLVFTSDQPLTPGANVNGAIQVYRYDAENGQLIRVSVGDNGFNDNGDSGTGGATIVGGYETVSRAGPARLDPTMADDGSRVFFQSPIALTSHALDDVVIDSEGDLAQNVYEWEQPGVGSCPASQGSGCVYLISDGRDDNVSTSFCSEDRPGSGVCLLGADTTGDNVFFETVDPLVSQDTDTGIDIYDARVGGGFPAGAGTPTCTGDDCQGSPAPPPPPPSVATVSFAAPGTISTLSHVAAPRVRVSTAAIRRGVRGSAFSVTVTVPGKGAITITGAAVRTSHKSAARAGTYKLRVVLTARGKRRLRHKRKLKLTLHVAYAGSSGGRSSVTFSIDDQA